METSAVGLVMGPGSVTVPIHINLTELRSRLSQAGHPLARAPQWNGDKVWFVECFAQDVRPRCLILATKTSERAEEVALANLKTRNGPEWRVVRCLEVEFNSHQLLLNVETSED